MEEILYKVFARIDEHSCITDIWSTGNQALGDKRTIEEIQELGYAQIDEGANGQIYGHAQVNYLRMKHGKDKFDENMLPNFKLVENEVKEVEPTEKEEWFIKPQRIAQEKANQEAMLQQMMARSQQISFLMDLPDEEAVKIPYCYDEWKTDKLYKVGDRVQADGKFGDGQRQRLDRHGIRLRFLDRPVIRDFGRFDGFVGRLHFGRDFAIYGIGYAVKRLL